MNINQLLTIAVTYQASDLHLKAGSYPLLRIHGELNALTQMEKLTPDDVRHVAETLTTEHQGQLLQEQLDIDISYGVKGLGRFRGSIYHQRGSLAIVMRVIPIKVSSIKELLLPPIIEKLALEPRGLILVTGTTGSGKSTTLAAMIDHINQTRSLNIITIEDPIEFLHSDRKSTISQREVGADVLSFSRGLMASLREDPDIILVGEMRDHDTIETALLAAETGHLVLSTLHTLDAPETINRIVTVFPPYYQKQVRIQLASILKAIISMRLISRKDGEGRVPAVEVLINTSFVSECIQVKEKTNLIRDAIKAGVSQYGMQSFDQSIYQLFKNGYISYEQGLQYTTTPNDFKLRVMGIQSSSDIARDDMEKDMGKRNSEPPPDEEDMEK
ncbi:MAG: type IV pilus twitching motility protein PilT [Acidobacteria bacterium]|nr:type IV pilus twitching motility protein PilT [Acidobacteriota bacterium]MBU4255158.1 type IV pilus twitching motility protein PilT [Acidobacteriota bacterium]MBU4496171.1 type IV pilus twitching motility protein PilT [Acidobacteriota bacterium]